MSLYATLILENCSFYLFISSQCMNVHDTLFLKMISSSLMFCVASYLIFEETSLCRFINGSINQTHLKSSMIMGSRFHVCTLVHTHTHTPPSFYFSKASFFNVETCQLIWSMQYQRKTTPWYHETSNWFLSHFPRMWWIIRVLEYDHGHYVDDPLPC